MNISPQDRYRGALLGLAAGDALGTTLEFMRPGTFEPVTDIVGGGPFRLKPGEWTDDTSMALCLAESLIACRGFDPLDQLERYLCWRCRCSTGATRGRPWRGRRRARARRTARWRRSMVAATLRD
jgi:ADP-ribosylglycohydrolase